MSQFGSSAVGYVGHQVHMVRRREARWLLDALGDVRGRTVIDVAGGDGYWASQLQKRGAFGISIDLAVPKLRRGQTLPDPPGQVCGDALRLPFPDAGADGVMSMCAIEHFTDGKAALAEMARICRPGGVLAISADTLSDEARWPGLSAGHRRRYAVVDTYDRDKLTTMLDAVGFEVTHSEYLFREAWSQGVYLRLHRWRYAPNVLAPLGPVVAASDRRSDAPGGAILLVEAWRR
jgi:ubiquinone/menaquinone biosynthesis C-methylase UbiE